MSILIRAFKIEDKHACLLAFRSNIPKYFAENEIVDFENFLHKVVDPNNNEVIPYYIILNHGKVVGCGGFALNENNTLSLTWGLIHQDFHNQGFGKQLLLFRLREIKKSFPDLLLRIDTSQHTYAFFEKYGFEVEKVTEDFYSIGLHRYDMNWNTERFNQMLK